MYSKERAHLIWRCGPCQFLECDVDKNLKCGAVWRHFYTQIQRYKPQEEVNYSLSLNKTHILYSVNIIQEHKIKCYTLKIFVNHTFVKKLLLRIYKKLSNSITKSNILLR